VDAPRNPAGPSFQSFADVPRDTPRRSTVRVLIGPSDPHRPRRSRSAQQAGLSPAPSRCLPRCRMWTPFGTTCSTTISKSSALTA
jgi:hypothetical protein